MLETMYVVEIVLFALLIGAITLLIYLTMSKFRSEVIDKKRAIGYSFGAFAGTVLSVGIWVYLLNTSRLFIGFIPGMALFWSFVLAEYLGTGRITEETIKERLIWLVTFTVGYMFVHYLI